MKIYDPASKLKIQIQKERSYPAFRIHGTLHLTWYPLEPPILPICFLYMALLIYHCHRSYSLRPPNMQYCWLHLQPTSLIQTWVDPPFNVILFDLGLMGYSTGVRPHYSSPPHYLQSSSCLARTITTLGMISHVTLWNTPHIYHMMWGGPDVPSHTSVVSCTLINTRITPWCWGDRSCT